MSPAGNVDQYIFKKSLFDNFSEKTQLKLFVGEYLSSIVQCSITLVCYIFSPFTHFYDEVYQTCCQYPKNSTLVWLKIGIMSLYVRQLQTLISQTLSISLKHHILHNVMIQKNTFVGLKFGSMCLYVRQTLISQNLSIGPKHHLQHNRVHPHTFKIYWYQYYNTDTTIPSILMLLYRYGTDIDIDTRYFAT